MTRTRTPAYRFSIYSLDSMVMRLLKQEIKIENMKRALSELENGGPKHKKRLVVTVKPRLGKNSPFADLYRKGGKYYQRSSQTIRKEHGAHFDIYVHERITWNFK